MTTESNEATELEGIEDSPPDLGRYPIDSLLIRSDPRSIFEVVRRIDQGTFILHPDFQRDFVWDVVRQSRLIESVLMRIPLPVIYLAENQDGKMVVVDGLQRLTTFHRFLNNGLKLELQNPDLNGKTFKDLSPKLQNRIEDAPLTLYLIDAKVPERARLDIFERVNGGAPLTRQQMRNALYQGKGTALLRELAEDRTFLDVTGRGLDRKSMRDREGINRFCAFHLLGPSAYPDDMDAFLASALQLMNRSDDAAIELLKQDFLRGLRNNAATFGKHAFRKHQRGREQRAVINMSLFDVFSTGLAPYDERRVVERQQGLLEGFYGLMDNPQFLLDITYGTSDKKRVLGRFQAAQHLLKEVLGDH